MRKALLIIMAVVVALSALPVTFACYNGGWGHWWAWGYWRPHKTITYCTPECSITFTSAQTSDNEGSSTRPQDIADTSAYITGCGKTIVVTVNNAYPGYEGILDFCVKNNGSLPATIHITINNPNPPEYLQLDLTGEVQEGAVIQPCNTKCGHLVIHGIPQLLEVMGRTFTFTITITPECIPSDCETAYAYGGCNYAHCFRNWYLGHRFTKWGWTNGPLGPGHYEFAIYAGAGQCYLPKGENIGTLTVDYDGSTATVTYNITGSGYRMTETHLYVGNAPWPEKNGGDYTVAPGDYPYSHTLDNAIIDFYPPPPINVSGPIYIIAHAVVCP
jgi:hypothetical protein